MVLYLGSWLQTLWTEWKNTWYVTLAILLMFERKNEKVFPLKASYRNCVLNVLKYFPFNKYVFKLYSSLPAPLSSIIFKDYVFYLSITQEGNSFVEIFVWVGI